jgi:hypothetical protein
MPAPADREKEESHRRLRVPMAFSMVDASICRCDPWSWMSAVLRPVQGTVGT